MATVTSTNQPNVVLIGASVMKRCHARGSNICAREIEVLGIQNVK